MAKVKTPPDGITPTREGEVPHAGTQRCVDLMTAGLWVAGRSHRELAAEFSVTEDTVKHWATAASRIIRMAVSGDLEDIRARMLATLDTVVRMAMTRQAATMGGDLYDHPDLKSAIAAIETQSKLLGLVVQKHEVQYTEEQARERYRQLTGNEWAPTEKPS